jgi:hypothetical protein
MRRADWNSLVERANVLKDAAVNLHKFRCETGNLAAEARYREVLARYEDVIDLLRSIDPGYIDSCGAKLSEEASRLEKEVNLLWELNERIASETTQRELEQVMQRHLRYLDFAEVFNSGRPPEGAPRQMEFALRED